MATSPIRVTQAGRQILYDGDLAIRVTQAGRQILYGPAYPSQPELISPVDTGVYSGILNIVYGQSVDPLGGTVWYYARWKKTTDSLWTDIFVDRTEVSAVVLDISGDDDGDYDFELWSETESYSSTVHQIEITVNNGMPTAPTITAPYEGQQWTKAINDVTWTSATDPDDDSLTYDARYKKVSASSWTSLFTGETDNVYEWNQAAFDVDDYELEVWADDGVSAGPADHVYFSIIIANQPDVPRIRIVEIGVDYVTVELEEYNHPFSVAWQATKWEIMPFGGSWTNPVESTTTTDSAEQLLYTFSNLAAGFRGVIRASFQDTSNSWGDPSAEVFASVPGTTTDWERRWERNAAWYLRGLGIEGRAGDWTTFHNQPISAIVDPNAESMGSFKVSGYVMAGGCYCGWGGVDTELRRLGVGVFKGDSENGGEYAVFFGLDFGPKTSGITGAHHVRPYLYANFEDCPSYSSKSVFGDVFTGYSQVTAGVQPQFGQPVGPWLSLWTHYPIYFLELWVQRNVATNTARIRGRINYVGFAGSSFPSSSVIEKRTASDEWDIDETVVCLTPCGRPGFYQGQYAYGWPSAYGEYYGLRYTALRDDGQTYVQNFGPLTPYEEPPPGPCTPVTEDALADPVFFPAPPNGDVEDDWVHPSDLIRARDDTEQRISLRDIPYERVSFNVTLPTAREVGQIHALIWEEQPSRWGVPLWMDAARLDVDLTSGSSSIPAASVDTDGRRFDEATHVAIWKDQFTWDFLPCTYNADGSISLTGTTSRTYNAYETYVIPCRIGRMGLTAEFPRSSPEIGDLEVTFVLEAVDG